MAAATTFESGHVDMVHDAQLDYYGKRLATCSSDRTVKVYRTPSTLHTASVNSIGFAPQELGLILACASSDGTVSIVQLTQEGNWETSKISNAHAIGVTAVSWAPAVPAGGLVASSPPTAVVRRLCTAGCDNTIKVWHNAEAGWSLEATLTGHTDWVRDAAWAPNLGLPVNTIASAGQDGKVIAWVEQTDGSWQNKVVNDFKVPVWKVSWSVAGNILAVSDGNNVITLWKETLDGVWQQVVQ
eukprot:GHRR01018259.1.p1 GENE.GHRR01018259.1~~GHRR01018259.1.p1  ORF type:complete len:242 (+),score=67.87 GHRR01018259.1:119-844(+)